MSLPRRLSMNTSLKEANIFDDEEWIKEADRPIDTKAHIKIKIETIKEENDSDEDYDKQFLKIKLEQNISDSPIKQEDINSSIKTRNSKRTAEQSDFKDEEPDHTPQKRRNVQTQTPRNVPYVKKRGRREIERNPEVLKRRQKQIDYGKNTIGYDNYITQIPRDKRELEEPQTPNKNYKYSRRAWDGLIKQWRLKLHKYD